MKLNLTQKSILLVVLILIADQVLKIYIKTHMMLGESFSLIGNWAIIHFTENNGMAFGMEFGGEFGKMALTIFRILAVILIAYYLLRIIREGAPKGVAIGIALILAGALGNIIDSVFYGVIFNDSYGSIATLFPPEGGYSSLLHGRVVDMFYVHLIDTTWPKWIPFIGGSDFVFFRPIFNIADSSISIGVVYLILFQRKFFAGK
ncbi:MAG: lipoprotein signal peptidase [Bacteroidales bacterium]